MVGINRDFVRPNFDKTKEIPWVIGEQTKVKHQLLRKYIDPWMKILLAYQSKKNLREQLIYIDGFSGPGVYWRNNLKRAKCWGSPLIVANVAKKYIKEKYSRKIYIIGIDKDKECVELLNFYLQRFNINYHQTWVAHQAEFETRINKILDDFEAKGLSNPPIFFFIDPFGYTGFSMSTLKRILHYPMVELFINFMVYDINRRASDPQFKESLVALFGTSEFLKVDNFIDTEDRVLFLRNLYCNQLLTNGGAEFVMPFRVNTPDQIGRARYFLIHVSKSFTALKLMKDAMASTSDQDYRFEAIGIIKNQENLFENPEKIALRQSLMDHIKSSSSEKSYDDIEFWAYKTTNGISKTIKLSLVELEDQGSIEIIRKARQQKNTVTSGAFIRSK
jgi:three-Cys-motif partner protein